MVIVVLLLRCNFRRLTITTVFYNAHHSPPGAFFTFTLGAKGAAGGFGCELGRPAGQSVYIALEREKAGTFDALPFFAPREKEVEAFAVSAACEDDGRVCIIPCPDEHIERTLSACCDSWHAGQLRFSLYSPVYEINDPEGDSHTTARLGEALMPVVTAELEVDNSRSARSRRVVFGFTGDDTEGMRHIACDDLIGVGQGRRFAACTSYPGAQSGIGFSVEDILAGGDEGFGLGSTGLIVITVPAGARVTVPLALCCFRDGVVTAGIDGKYLYTRYYASVTDVAAAALGQFDARKQAAEEADTWLSSAHLYEPRAFMHAHAIHSYYGSTQCLVTDEGVRWIVNEGEYRMINTLDLAVDHLFFELTVHPWVVKNIARMYRDHYRVYDKIPAEHGQHEAGVSFTHDMGVANVFSGFGRSAYECAGKKGCFSYMTHEELVNWVIVSVVYALYCGDTPWMKEIEPLLEECVESLVNRDDPDTDRRKGFMQRDSTLTGDGYEITTYDSLDETLGRARANSYGAVKRWAAFILLHSCFQKLHIAAYAERCMVEALRTADCIVSSCRSDGIIPSFLDGTDAGIALPVIEGLVYPWFAGCHEPFQRTSRFAPLISATCQHFTAALTKNRCLGSNGEWLLSSSSDITWLSKLYLCRFVATELLGIPEDTSWLSADMLHASWLTAQQNAPFAWSDQFRLGSVVGSRYYPRGVTSLLWLMEQHDGQLIKGSGV